jgi:Ser/Thr protein kinase RdoA (MazF antagonist)
MSQEQPKPSASQVAVVKRALSVFAIDGEFTHVEPLLRGHINQTWVSTWEHSGESRRYLHQRINETVFQQVGGLMENIKLVTARLAETSEEAGYEPLVLIPAKDGECWARRDSGAWRTYEFIEDTAVFDRCSGPEQAYATARIFGWFQASLATLDANLFHETIPEFFSPGHRWRQFEASLTAIRNIENETTKQARDLVRRRDLAKREIEYALSQSWLIELFEGHLASGAIPSRIVHGDTKLNNVLFDSLTGQARCVVDLDTCMPGFSLYDFGDMVRFTAATSDEDERDLSQAGTDLDVYRALAGGYLECAGQAILPLERELLHLAGPLISLVIGLRFLADHLQGDVYFGAHRVNHNLDRARVQFAQVAHMEKMRDQMLGG